MISDYPNIVNPFLGKKRQKQSKTRTFVFKTFGFYAFFFF